MPIPAITDIAPRFGPAGGGLLVEIRGTGFVSGSPTPRITFGGRPASDVRVFTSELLSCVTPAGEPGAADVVLANLDADGEAITGELSAAPGAFLYLRPPLTVEADLTRLVRELLQQLKRQVLPNVVLTVHTDFDRELGVEVDLASIAELPGLVLLGPELAEDRFFSLNGRPEAATGLGQFAQRRAPYTVDLTFTLLGVSDHTMELLNLLAATQLFFHRNKYLELARDPHDAEVGSVRYEMDIAPDGGLRVTSQPNESNIRSFSGRFVVRGFDFEDLASFPGESIVSRGAVADDVSVSAPQPLANSPNVGSSQP